MPELTHLFRYENGRHAPPLDEFGDFGTGLGTAYLRLDRYRILKKTPKGYWIHGPGSKPKFVLTNAKKRFACTSIEEAAISFRARKERQALIHESRARTARDAIKMVEAQMRRDQERYDEERFDRALDSDLGNDNSQPIHELVMKIRC